MLRKSLAVLALVTLAATPVLGQVEEYEWTNDRPDARPPGALFGVRMLEMSDLQIEYRFAKMNYGDIRFETEVVPFLDVLDAYQAAPFGRTHTDHILRVSYGLMDWLTLEGRAGWLTRDRAVGTEDVFVDTNSSGISDIEAAALISVVDRDGVKAHLIGGVEIPTGSIEKVGPDITGTPRLLPYEMQLGTGSFSVAPGVAASMQNDIATIGANVRAFFRLNDNGRGYRLGDAFRGNFWASYLLTENFSITTGARVHKWGSIEGRDSALDPLSDPGADPLFSSGTTVDIPLGLNIRLSEGLLTGTDIQFEFVWPTYESFDAPRPQGDWGFNLTLGRDLPLFWK